MGTESHQLPSQPPSQASVHLAVQIARPVADVYAFAADPANLPQWAAGLGGPMVREGDAWFFDTPGGRAQIVFAPINDLGVLDHDVLTPSGETVHVPMRVIVGAAGSSCSEVVFTLRRGDEITDDDFAHDQALVTADLERLRDILEAVADR